MSSSEDETEFDEADESSHGIKHYIVWFLAAMLIFAGLGALISGSGPVGILRGLLAAALLISAGIVAIAYTTETEHLEPIRTPLPANALMVAAIVIVLVMAGGLIGPSSDTVENADPDAVEDGNAPIETEAPADTADNAGDDDDEDSAATTEPSGGGDDGGGDDTPAPTEPPTDTPAPTEPPTDTRTATASPQPSLDSYEFSDNGQRVTDSFALDGGLVVFTMDHDGSSNFQIELIDEDTGEIERYLANEIGEWQAEQPYYVPEGNYVLDVNADGNWNINVEQPRPSPSEAEGPPVSASDQYPNYIGPVQFDGLHRIRGEYNGDSNFVVWVLDEDGRERELIFNEIGEFEGEGTYSGNHVGYIRIEATGDWTVEAE